MKALRQCALLAALAMVATPQSALACATCFGNSDSDLAKAMNWGILSLLAVVVLVLGGLAAFFVYLARRAAMTAGTETPIPDTVPEKADSRMRTKRGGDGPSPLRQNPDGKLLGTSCPHPFLESAVVPETSEQIQR